MNKLVLKDTIELVGILAIVASLVFVGMEIQQNSAIARLEARQVTDTQNIEIALAIAANPEMTKVMGALSSNQVEDLDPEESFRLFFTVFSILIAMQSTFGSVQEGILPEASLEGLGIAALNRDFVRERLGTYRILLTNQEFVDYLEEELAASQ